MKLYDVFEIRMLPDSNAFQEILEEILGVNVRPEQVTRHDDGNGFCFEAKLKIKPTDKSEVHIMMNHDLKFMIIPYNSKGQKFPTRYMPFNTLDKGTELVAYLIHKGYLAPKRRKNMENTEPPYIEQLLAEAQKKRTTMTMIAIIGWIAAAVAIAALLS